MGCLQAGVVGQDGGDACPSGAGFVGASRFVVAEVGCGTGVRYVVSACVWATIKSI